MSGYAGFRRILRLLLVQTAVIAIALAWDIWSLGAALLGNATSAGNSVATVLAAAAAVMLLMRAAWDVAIEPVELLWGTSAKVRIRKWLEPALLASALAVALCAIAAAFAVHAPELGPVALGIALLALIAPFGMSLLLLVSAVRRGRAYRHSIARMSATLPADSGAAGLSRVRASVRNEAGTVETDVKPNPQGFTFAGLSSRPWHDPADFPWLQPFVDATEEITQEAMQALRAGTGIQNYDYVGLDGDFWKSFKFVARHEPVAENMAQCPVTAALLKTVPGYPSFRDAMFSILGPGGVIRPHRDVSNVFLTLHLPLIAPENGEIEVGGLSRTWQRGVPLVFDSSYTHQAINGSDETRVILLVDFLHPDLTEAERAWVRDMRL